MDVLTFLEALASMDPIAIAHVLSGSVIIAAIAVFAQVKNSYYRIFIVLVAVSAFGLLRSIYHQSDCLISLFAIALTVTVTSLFCAWIHYNRQLEQIARKNDLISPEHNPAEAISDLKQLNDSHLIGSQIERYNRYKVYTYVALGNNAVAKAILEKDSKYGDEATPIEPAFRHFFLHIIADRAGDFSESQTQLNEAFAHKDDRKTDSLLVIQLEHNQAVLHVNSGQYSIANDEFKKVISHAKELNVKNKDLLNILYENYALNKTRLGLPDGGISEGWEAIDEYAETLDCSRPFDTLALFNMKLQFTRQIGASPDEKQLLCDEHINYLTLNNMLSETEALTCLSSMARICWSDGLDPTRVIEFLSQKTEKYYDLDPGDRYTSLNNLCAMLENLITEDRNALSLREFVAQYFLNDADDDLNSWEMELPPEAYRMRASILRQKAGMQQRKGNLGQAEELMNEAIKLLESNLEKLEAIEYRLALAEMLTANLPVDCEEKTQIADKALKHMRETELFLQSLQEHPMLGLPYAQLSKCYALLNMPDECINAYTKAVSYPTPLDHYAPHIRAEKTVAAFCARFFIFIRSIYQLKDQIGTIRISPESKAWIEAFPDVTTFQATILLGMFFGIEENMSMVKSNRVSKENRIRIEHYWLDIPELNMSFDPTIRNTISDVRGQVFQIGKHPELNIDPVDLQQTNSGEEYKLLNPTQYWLSISMVDHAIYTVLKEVLATLDRATKGSVPNRDELKQMFLSSVVDIPIP